MAGKSASDSMKIDTKVSVLGPAKVSSPLTNGLFMSDDATITVHVNQVNLAGADISGYAHDLELELAGARQNLYFDSTKVKCAVVSCGGLCPGINDVIQSIVMTAHYHYQVSGVVGIRFGLEGFIPKYRHDIMELTPQKVVDIHQFGGTILGSSRGPQSPSEIVDALERMNINVLFVIGGDGSMKAANLIAEEVRERNQRIAIIGIPKTIDNDISFVTNSFGFDTAVGKATEAIDCAHIEANGAFNGIGLVKLMGRESGFIAAHATLGLKEVNFVLVPEKPFVLKGENGLLAALEERLKKRRHAVIVCAEGAGQNLLKASAEKDPSGNVILGDICDLLCREIKDYFAKKSMPITLKFIDPSYIIRSVPANTHDSIYCGLLGQNAVHAAMAGKTAMAVSSFMDQYVYLPFSLVIRQRRKLNINSAYWRSVMDSTGQPEIAES